MGRRLTLLTRAIAYLGVVYRKQGDLVRTREYADYTLQIAKESQMPQYTGMAYSNYGWLAWCAGDMIGTKIHGQSAIQEWGGLGVAQSVVPFRWLILLPLMGVALQEEEIEKAVEFAQHLLTSPQQRLPEGLTNLLQSAITAWKDDHPLASFDQLGQAFQLSHEMGYV